MTDDVTIREVATAAGNLAAADLEHFQAAVRRVGDMAMAFNTSTGRIPTKVRIPKAEEPLLVRGMDLIFAKRAAVAGSQLTFCGLDLEFHDGDAWSVTR